jgi:hypothetical protein
MGPMMENLEQRIEDLAKRIAVAKSNSCHVPSGPAGGQFCEGGGSGTGAGGGSGTSNSKQAAAEKIFDKASTSLGRAGYTLAPKYQSDRSREREQELRRDGIIQDFFKHPSGKDVDITIKDEKLSWRATSPVKRQGKIYSTYAGGDTTRSGTVTSTRRSGYGEGMSSLQRHLDKSK